MKTQRIGFVVIAHIFMEPYFITLCFSTSFEAYNNLQLMFTLSFFIVEEKSIKMLITNYSDINTVGEQE